MEDQIKRTSIYYSKYYESRFVEYIERCKAAGYNLNSDQKKKIHILQKDAQGNTLSLKYKSGREMSIIVIKRTAITSSNNKEKLS